MYSLHLQKTQEKRCVSLRHGVLDPLSDNLPNPAVEVVDILGDTEVVEPLDLSKGLLDPLVVVDRPFTLTAGVFRIY